MNSDRRRFGVLAIIAVAGVCGSLLMFWITDYGPGVSPDAIHYLEAAQSLFEGNGLSVEGKPMTHYAPAYSILLAGAGLLCRGDILQAARLLAAVLFGANIVLFGLVVQMCTARSLSATACAIFLFLSSAPIISVHSMALTESPFIAFTLASFVLLSLYIMRPALYLLLSASLMAGCAASTRYVGVTLLPPMALALLLFGDRPRKRKVRDAAMLTIVGSLPLASWLVRNRVTAHTATNRGFAFHPFGLSHARALIITMHDFILPLSVSFWLKAFLLGVAAVLVLLALALLYRKGPAGPDPHPVRMALPTLCVTFPLTYIAFLVLSISFFDAHTPICFRILVPILLPLVAAGISLAWYAARVLHRRFIWYGFVLFALLAIVVNGRHAIARAIDIHEKGRGFTSRYWQNSETVSYLAQNCDSGKIYSNGPDVIRFRTGKEAVMIPWKVSPFTLSPDRDYGEASGRMLDECREGEAVIVYLDGITWRWYLPSARELEAGGSLPVLRKFKDGVVYGENPGSKADQSAENENEMKIEEIYRAG